MQQFKMNPVFMTDLLVQVNHSMTLGFKLQLLSRMERFYIYSTFKCFHDCMVHQGQQHMKN
jgi:hypothetical protein